MDSGGYFTVATTSRAQQVLKVRDSILYGSPAAGTSSGDVVVAQCKTARGQPSPTMPCLRYLDTQMTGTPINYVCGVSRT